MISTRPAWSTVLSAIRGRRLACGLDVVNASCLLGQAGIGVDGAFEGALRPIGMNLCNAQNPNLVIYLPFNCYLAFWSYP